MVYKKFNHRDAIFKARDVQWRVSAGGLRIYRRMDAQDVSRDLRPPVTSSEVQHLETVLSPQVHAMPMHMGFHEI